MFSSNKLDKYFQTRNAKNSRRRVCPEEFIRKFLSKIESKERIGANEIESLALPDDESTILSVSSLCIMHVVSKQRMQSASGAQCTRVAAGGSLFLRGLTGLESLEAAGRDEFVGCQTFALRRVKVNRRYTSNTPSSPPVSDLFACLLPAFLYSSLPRCFPRETFLTEFSSLFAIFQSICIQSNDATEFYRDCNFTRFKV